MAPKYQSSNAGDLNMPKRSHEVLRLSEKVSKIYSKNESSIWNCEGGKRKSVWFAPQTTKVMDMTEWLITPTHKGWLHRFRNRSRLKNIKITGEAESADEEVTATFLTVLELIKEKGYQKRKSSVAMKLGSFGRRCPREATFMKVQRRYQGIKHGRTDELWYYVATLQGMWESPE